VLCQLDHSARRFDPRPYPRAASGRRRSAAATDVDNAARRSSPISTSEIEAVEEAPRAEHRRHAALRYKLAKRRDRRSK
jgi:hypothetical protein